MELIILLSCVAFTYAGIISHNFHGDDEGHHEEATSYQNFHIEHFFPVPTFLKHHDKHLFEHPVSKGKSSAKIEIHHGSHKHDPGYAIVDTHSDSIKGFDDLFEGHHEDLQHLDKHQHQEELGGFEADHHSFHQPQIEHGSYENVGLGHFGLHDATGGAHGYESNEGHYEGSHE